MGEEKLKIEHLTELGRKILPKGASLWLYGSRARGTARKDSDWDLLVLIDKDKRENSDFMEYTMPFIDLGVKYGEAVMPHLYTYKQWKDYSFTPFEKNVERDKIVLI